MGLKNTKVLLGAIFSMSITKVRVRDSLISGKGLFATQTIRKGEAVLQWHPKVLTKEQAAKLPKDEQEHYLYPDGDKMLWMQPPERYVNHSCESNTHIVDQSDVASRDILPSEEITSDYMDLETENFKCTCGSSRCRKPAKGSVVGLKRGTVKVATYNPNWPKEFEAEKQNLIDAFGDKIVAVEHIGSTSIPGLAAKPIIDIAVAVKSFDDLSEFIEGLQKLDYEYMPERMFDDRKFFPKGSQENRTHHLNLVIQNDPEQWTKPIAFRDYLRNHEVERELYANLKASLAKQYANDRATYTKLKDDFFQSIFHEALP